MTFDTYLSYSDDIVNKKITPEAYNDPLYYEFAKLNASRTKRWLKTYQIPEEVKNKLAQIKTPQQWIIITEPWCGDAAHIVPILYLLSESNSHISLDIQLRDEAPYLINDYLTNGGKSIPMLIIRAENGEDKAVWGPRPNGATALFQQLKQDNVTFDDLKLALQQWYNEDKGQQIGAEVAHLATQ